MQEYWISTLESLLSILIPEAKKFSEMSFGGYQFCENNHHYLSPAKYQYWHILCRHSSVNIVSVKIL